MSNIKKTIGIDLGTATTLIYQKNKGIVLREPSFVTVDTHTYKVLAAGQEAKDMIGKTPGDITSFRPLKDGVIADFDVAVTMLKMFMTKAAGNLKFNPCRVIICVPDGITEVEKRAVESASLEAGAASVALVEVPIAAAVGAGIPVGEAKGSMVVDIGGGRTEVAVISLGSIVLSESIRIGGNKLDSAIADYVKHSYNILIGESAAEELKIQIGTVHKEKDRGECDLRGRNLISGLPAVTKIQSSELREAIAENVDHIIDCICLTLEKTPPELAGDIYDGGITLTGGGALLGGIGDLLNERTGVRINIAPNAPDCVANGIGVLIESNEILTDFVSFKPRKLFKS